MKSDSQSNFKNYAANLRLIVVSSGILYSGGAILCPIPSRVCISAPLSISSSTNLASFQPQSLLTLVLICKPKSSSIASISIVSNKFLPLNTLSY